MLPVAGTEAARKVADESLPSNSLMQTAPRAAMAAGVAWQDKPYVEVLRCQPWHPSVA